MRSSGRRCVADARLSPCPSRAPLSLASKVKGQHTRQPPTSSPAFCFSPLVDKLAFPHFWLPRIKPVMAGLLLAP